jgi:hypothetical protein
MLDEILRIPPVWEGLVLDGADSAAALSRGRKIVPWQRRAHIK